MPRDEGLQRAAAVIAWHIARHKTESEAVARAAEHEPALTDSDLRNALQWARDTISFTDALNMACEICDNCCDANGNLPPPGKGPKAADIVISELAAKFGLPRT